MESRIDWEPLSVTNFIRVHPPGMVATIFGVSVAGAVTVAWASAGLDVEFLNLHVSVWSFQIAWALLLGHLAYARVPSTVIGTGLYVASLSFLARSLLLDGAPPAVPAIPNATLTTLLIGATLLALGAYLRRRGKRRRLYEASRELMR